MQTYPEGPAAEHERKRCHDHKQGNALRIDPRKGLKLVLGAEVRDLAIGGDRSFGTTHGVLRYGCGLQMKAI
jgi:hypothetical protein